MDVTKSKARLEAVLQSLRGLAIRPATQAAEILQVAFEHAARPLTPEQQSTRIDREAARSLTDALTRDAILEHLPLATLAALLERSTQRLNRGAAENRPTARQIAWLALDLVRRSEVLKRIDEEARDDWAKRILAAIDASHLTVGPLFRQRVDEYGSRTLFQLPPNEYETSAMRWTNASQRAQLIARGLLALDPDGEPGPVAILSENRLEMALADIACLTSGIVNVMVPGNSTGADVEFILRHCHARTVMVSNRRQLQKLTQCRDALPDLRHVISLDPKMRRTERVTSWNDLLVGAEGVPAATVVERSNGVRSEDLATIMYTSGTTGTPKAIQFSQRNLVFKRFARALALPEIGDRDTFLCFLPLFHTFGRFLEMLGCIFWGATYCFIENPSVDALIRGMQRYEPTVFISVPKKWIQLYESIGQRVDPLLGSDEELQAVTDQLTGGKLRWGLSAAGYLDSDIFRFFQARGVELMSGFGMTEATGGITMTPPERYRNDSLGGALPGIEISLAEDGELLVRGGYVMIGYLDPSDGRPSFDEEGWFHTGDLMELDDAGFIKLVDRKKEIYKNVKGETIAPQRIENLFRDLESVGRAFLVGDHREFNTLLIYPNPDYRDIDLANLTPDELRDHFRSLVVSVNKFLAPFERVVDFALIDRDLDPEKGELTPKGTPRRKNVAQNFSEQISALYRRTYLNVGGVEIVLPNWLLQVVGMTAQDLTVENNTLRRTGAEPLLTIEALGNNVVRVGDVAYGHPPGVLDLGALLSAPRLWLGNGPLVDFLPLDFSERQRPGRTSRAVRWIRRYESSTPPDT
ncbi:MAG: AMP-binding protein, partial [Acidobacteriota bacterium]|nr:AMP-binding protein [Acidobacteriota bacterium]